MLLLRGHRLELLVASACLALLCYVTWACVYGPRSFLNRDKLVAQYAQLNADLAGITSQRVGREAQVQRLRPESIDADLVDEISRRDLNLAKPNDLVVVIQP